MTSVQGSPPEISGKVAPTEPAPALSAEKAFALMLETACEDFEILQDLIRGEARMVSENQGPAAPIDKVHRLRRAPARIQMALAKSFVFNARRANRICAHNKAGLALDRLDRTRFLKATDPLTAVRDVNEHGFDGSGAVRPSMHRQEGGLLDETSLMIGGPDKILVGRSTFTLSIWPSTACESLPGSRPSQRKSAKRE
jgi:hypothetical protein